MSCVESLCEAASSSSLNPIDGLMDNAPFDLLGLFTDFIDNVQTNPQPIPRAGVRPGPLRPPPSAAGQLRLLQPARLQS